MKHAVYLPDARPEHGELVVEGEEGRHAVRVKRLREGDGVEVLTGAGVRLTTRVLEATRRLRLSVLGSQEVRPEEPAVEICSPPPKGPRLGDMIDQLSQVGATSWRPLKAAFAAERLTPARRERLERVAIEAMKQCRRAWLLEIGPELAVAEALVIGPGADLLVADASGEPYEPAPGALAVRVLVGPEGGWRADELETARRAGARVCRFGPHVMRLETAAVVAGAAVRARAHEALGSAPGRRDG